MTTIRSFAFAFASLLTATTVHAQAPGQWASPPPPAAGAPPAPAPASATFTQRWSVAIGVGSLRVVDGMSDGEASFDIGQLALRFRATPHLELEASGGGGNERYADGTQGTLAVASFTLAARYRFNPEQHWNGWVLAGVGGTTVAPKDAPKDVVDGAQRGHGVIGAGLEYRFTRFALQAEVRGYAFGDSQAEIDAQDMFGQQPTTELTGSNLTVGAAYYF